VYVALVEASEDMSSSSSSAPISPMSSVSSPFSAPLLVSVAIVEDALEVDVASSSIDVVTVILCELDIGLPLPMYTQPFLPELPLFSAPPVAQADVSVTVTVRSMVTVTVKAPA
jgi:hypothetical protein